ncbi:MAG: ribosome silencing factor [Bacteroidetes bacterium]|nr:MAG: ribosome silencing factor [Bacteroidota bacterium]
MSKKTTVDEGLVLCDVIVKGMEEKKAHDIVVLDLRKIKSAVADFFVICHGDSDTQVEAIGRSIDDEVEKALNERPWHKEGYENAEWVLLDYVNVVAHVFLNEKREFYAIEELWGDAVITRY